MRQKTVYHFYVGEDIIRIEGDLVSVSWKKMEVT